MHYLEQEGIPSRRSLRRNALITMVAIMTTFMSVLVPPLTPISIAACGVGMGVSTLLGPLLIHQSVLRLMANQADLEKAKKFRKLVQTTCHEQGIKPPRTILLFGSRKDGKANAFATRTWRQGSGMIAATEALVDELTKEELRSVIRHELVHYRHADSRSTLLRMLGLAGQNIGHVLGISSFIGWIQPFGTVAIIGITSIGWTAFAGSMAYSRKLERRADRESVQTAQDAEYARSGRVKLSVRSLRIRNERWQRLCEKLSLRKGNLDTFGAAIARTISNEQLLVKVTTPPQRSTRIANFIFGTHPLNYDRIAMFERLSSELETDGTRRVSYIKDQPSREIGCGSNLPPISEQVEGEPLASDVPVMRNVQSPTNRADDADTQYFGL